MNTIDPLVPLDLDRWMKEYPLTFTQCPFTVDDELEHLCLLEQLRNQALGNSRFSWESFPMDMFVLAYGEPCRRDVSKIGGLPYRPADVPWPLSLQSGEPMTFLAQLRFVESVDLVGGLSGDILLVFFEELNRYSPYHHEWYDLGIPESQLVTEESVPRTEVSVPKYFGLRHRYSDTIDNGELDYLWEYALERKSGEWPDVEEEETQRRNQIRASAGQLCVFKIGGVPYWAQPVRAAFEHACDGRFLGMIPPLFPSENEKSWTWDGLLPDDDDGVLLLDHECCLHLFLTDDGKVVPRFASLNPW